MVVVVGIVGSVLGPLVVGALDCPPLTEFAPGADVVVGEVDVVVAVDGDAPTTAAETVVVVVPDADAAVVGGDVDPAVVLVVAAVVLVVDTTVVVVEVAVEVHTAYSARPPAGIVIDCPFEYDVPVPADAVSHLDSTYPSRVKPEPLLSVTVEPVDPVVGDSKPVPPLGL